MIKLNLVTSCEEHELIKKYLEENASEILADKINNGVKIVKDGVTLINKKTLDGFMNFATEEAKKAAILAGSESFKWGAITGVISGGASEAVKLYRSSKTIPSPVLSLGTKPVILDNFNPSELLVLATNVPSLTNANFI